MVDVGELRDANPAKTLQRVFEDSDGWSMSAWTDAALVLSRAALKHMLVKVESELGKRNLMSTHRPTR